MKKRNKKAIAWGLVIALTAGSMSMGSQVSLKVQAAGTTVLSDLDISSIYHKVSYQRQSVHDPSIIDDGSGTYQVLGSHMGAAQTKDLMNWSAIDGISETEDSTLYGVVESGKVKQASYNEAFKKNEVTGETTLYGADGTPYTVNFGEYNMNNWISPNSIVGNQWAPDVIYNKDMKKWCMYQSLNGSSWNSAVVLLTADDKNGPYVYQGPVVFSGFQASNDDTSLGRSYKNTDLAIAIGQNGELDSLPEKYNKGDQWGTYWPHAIDPCVFYDDDGKLWLSYGSWSGGIYMLELDEKTGFRDYSVKYDSDYDTKGASVTTDEYFGKKIAGGYYSSGEGSYIEKIGDKYVLYVSYGFYSPEGGYEMRLFYSDNPDGPYVDTNGTTAIYSKYELNYSPSAVTNRGQKLMGNYQWDTMDVAEIAQGHNSSFVDSNGRAYVIYHTKFNDGTAGHQLRVHELFTTKDGYVVASPYEFSSSNAKITKSTSYTASELTGNYQVITHKYKMKCKDKGGETEVNSPVDIVLNENGTVTGDLTGTWSNEAGTPYATLVLGGKTYKGVFAKQNISGENLETMCFTILDNTTGLCIWGSHEVTDREAVARNVVNYKVAIPSNTYNNITLPTDAADGVNISWASSEPDVIAADGTVTTPDKDTKVTLTVTFAKNNVSYSKVYTTNVVGGGAAGEDIETGLVASYGFNGNLKNEKNTAQAGTPMAQTSGTKPQLEYNAERGTKVLHQYFGYDGASSISYTKFDNPLQGKSLEGATVSLWVNREDSDVWDSIWGFLDGNKRLFLQPNAYLGYNNGADSWFDLNNAATVTNAITPKEWHLVSLTVGSDDITIYVDGVKKYNKDVTAAYNSSDGELGTYANEVLALLSSASDFYLGYGSFWGSAPLLLDNLKIYERALSEGAMAKLYAEELKEVDEALNGEVDDTSDYFYYQNYNSVKSVADVWSSTNASGNLSIESDSNEAYKKYVQFSFAGTSTNSRSAYTDIDAGTVSDRYTVEFDTQLTAGNNQQSQLALSTKKCSSITANRPVTSDYVWEMSATNSTTWTLSNGDTVTIPKATWVHIKTDIDKTKGEACLTIKNGSNVLYKGIVECGSNADVKGIYLLSGRYGGVFAFDNVAVRTALSEGLLGEFLFKDNLTDTSNSGYEAEIISSGEDTLSRIVADPVSSRGNVMEMRGTWNGTGYLELPKEYLSKISDSFTVTMWAKANNSKSGEDGICGTSAGIFNFNTRETGNFRFIAIDSSLHPWINDGNGNFIDRSDENVNLSTTKWQQITMCIDDSSICVYIDGVLTEKKTVLGGGTFASLMESIKNAKNIQIGTLYPWWATWDFRGYVDDIRLYNRTLSAKEVAELYTLSGDESVMIGK